MEKNTNNTPSVSAATPVSKQLAVAIVTVAILATGLTTYRWATVPLGASLTGSGALTRADCFQMQRLGRLTPECRTLLFPAQQDGATGFVTTTATAIATSDPNTPTPSPKLPIGSKCLNDDQCATANCVMSPSIDGGPSLLIGVCGCRARPACLNSQPACALPETPDMCVCGNGQCEVGEKTSCPQDCRSGSPLPTDAPTCSSCLQQGLGYLCRGGFTGGSFCNAENGGAGADFTCVACADQPTRCVPEGQACSTNTDCGTCGATCQGSGITDSIPPHIIDGKCTYPRSCTAVNSACTTDGECCSGRCGALPGTPADSGRVNVCLPKVVPSASPAPLCDHAAPPEGCRYIPGPDYDPITTCGLVLECTEPSGQPVPSSGMAYPYVPIEQATCSACLAQGKSVSCTDISTSSTLNTRGFCASTLPQISTTTILTDPVCISCPSDQDTDACPKDLKDCGNGISVGREGSACDFPICPTKRDISLFLPDILRAGDKSNLAICIIDQDGRPDTSYRGWTNIAIDAGPIADVVTHLSYEFNQADRGCKVFPIALQPVKEGLLKLTAVDLHFSDLEVASPSMEKTVTRTVFPSRPTPPSCNERRGDASCDGSVNIADLALISDVLIGKVSLPSSAMARRNADLNGDGVFNIADLASLTNLLAHIPVAQ